MTKYKERQMIYANVMVRHNKRRHDLKYLKEIRKVIINLNPTFNLV
jgi:hypothetical protein